MATISITHQESKQVHKFKVKNAKDLQQQEVNRICEEMGCSALFINGRIYYPSGKNKF